MLFYRVKEERYDYFTGNGTIKGELLTKKERDTKFRYLPDSIFETVNVNKNNTFWCFGARFEVKRGN